ncbi:plasmid recombination protein [Pikeienuella sp. HZG-20]|uniref:plasmid recombination protein n=1 Tax=Paludibacillus litoralis TaxID=3133267 RepID=UPI0030EE40F7
MAEQSPPEHPVVLRFAGMFPADLGGYETHRTRKGGDLGHVNPNPPRPNRVLIGPRDWAARARAMIDKMKTENYADELEPLTRQRRTSQIKKRMVEGPRDPWRATRHGPLREVILTANRKWFEKMDPNPVGTTRERAFEDLAVAWLKDSFGDDVVHARADLDETTYHIHAVIVPAVEINLNGATRRMLQPSKHALIKDYEAAQDSVGAWFAPIGLVRGERRAAAVKAARQVDEEPPEYRQYARTAEWRADQELMIERATGKIEKREADCATAEAAIAARRADIAAREDAARGEDQRLAAERKKLREERRAAKDKAEAADAVLAVADGLASGALEVSDDGGAPRLGFAPDAAPAVRQGLRERIRRSPLGASRAGRAFSAAFHRFRARALAEAEAAVSRDAAEIKRADDVIFEIASHLPMAERKRIADIRKRLTAAIMALDPRRREARRARGSDQKPDRGAER